MPDWIGLLFFALVAIGVYAGLRALSRSKPRTEEEFERGIEQGGGLAGAGMNALHQALNPAEKKRAEVKLELKAGRYNKKKREGKAGGTFGEEEDDKQ